MSPLSRIGALAIVALTLLGCSTWRPAPAGFVRPAPPDAFALPGDEVGVRLDASIVVESPRFAGRFRALVAGNTGPAPRVRIQLYPDVGGKILDLAASTDRVIGFTTDGSQRLDVTAPTPLPRGFLTFLALTLLDRYRPPSAADSFQISTDDRGDVAALLRPSAWPGHQVEESQRFNRRIHHYRSVQWTEESAQDRIVIAAPELLLTVENIEIDHDSPLPLTVFELELPNDGS